MRSPPVPAPRPPGFTLVEVMTATAVLSILFSIMFSILQQTSKGWQAANRRVEASQVARLALEQIASDLENCVAISTSGLRVPGSTNPRGYAFGFVHSHAPSFRTDDLATDSLPSQVNLSMPNDYIFVVTPYAPSMALGSGDLCEVGYIPVYVARSGGYVTVRQGRYVLLRHMPVAFPTVNTTVANAQPVTDFLANPDRWFLTPRLQNNNPPDAPNFFPIVDNLIAFNVELIHTNSAGALTTFPRWGRPSTNNSGWTNKPTGAPDGLPLAADITLCIMDDKAAERIQRIPTRGLSRALDQGEKEEVSKTPVDWNSPRIGSDVRSTLQESVLTLKRRVFFKNAQP